MNKEADQLKRPDSQEQELPKIDKEKLQEILAQHKRWVESDGKGGARADLREANLHGAVLEGADLHGADLRRAEGLTASQVMAARNWRAYYDEDFLKELGLHPEHNYTLRKQIVSPAEPK